MASCVLPRWWSPMRTVWCWSRRPARARRPPGMCSGRGSCCWPRMAGRIGRSASRSDCTTTRSRCGGTGTVMRAPRGLVATERPGRPPVYDADDVILLVKTATETPPEPASRWTMEALARRLNEAGVAISVSQVWRICQALDLKPWQYESWMTSHDPDFWVKAADVCGLYV